MLVAILAAEWGRGCAAVYVAVDGNVDALEQAVALVDTWDRSPCTAVLLHLLWYGRRSMPRCSCPSSCGTDATVTDIVQVVTEPADSDGMEEIGDAVGLLAMAMSVRHMALVGLTPSALVRAALGRPDVVAEAIRMQATRLDRERRDVHNATMRRLEDALDLAAGVVFRAAVDA